MSIFITGGGGYVQDRKSAKSKPDHAAPLYADLFPERRKGGLDGAVACCRAGDRRPARRGAAQQRGSGAGHLYAPPIPFQSSAAIEQFRCLQRGRPPCLRLDTTRGVSAQRGARLDEILGENGRP